jgi:hypothetical protein
MLVAGSALGGLPGTTVAWAARLSADGSLLHGVALAAD